MSNPLTQAEQTLSLTPEQAAAFFGYSRAQWYALRNSRAIPDRLAHSIQAHLLLPAPVLKKLIETRLPDLKSARHL